MDFNWKWKEKDGIKNSIKNRFHTYARIPPAPDEKKVSESGNNILSKIVCTLVCPVPPGFIY